MSTPIDTESSLIILAGDNRTTIEQKMNDARTARGLPRIPTERDRAIAERLLAAAAEAKRELEKERQIQLAALRILR